MKTTELKDVLHLYIGCAVRDTFNDCDVVLTPKAYAGYMEHWDKPEDGQIKPYLRDLSDMTEDEKMELAEILGVVNVQHFINAWVHKKTYATSIHNIPELFPYLLSRGFDLFGLIKNNHALRKAG